MSNRARPCNRLRDLRMTQGWTQAELARRAGVSRAAVSAIEINRLLPSVTAALKLAGCLGCTVEELFSDSGPTNQAEWAWSPPMSDERSGKEGRISPPWQRYWRAEVAGRLLWFPCEETAAGELAHDGVMSASGERQLPDADPSRTLIVACCDPAAALLASEFARQSGLRMIVLSRSSGIALELLKNKRIHVAGVHLSGTGGRNGNARAVQREMGATAALLRLAKWEEGVSIGPSHDAHSLENTLRRRLRWIGREPGSGARQCLDELLGSRKQPVGIAYDHRGVANALKCGWADAGVCVRLVSEEAGLRFLPVRVEDYDLCFHSAMDTDPRIQALIRVVRSAAYRRLLGELPGYDVAETGSLERT